MVVLGLAPTLPPTSALVLLSFFLPFFVLFALALIATLILYVIVGGAYPFLVRSLLSGEELSLAKAFGSAFRRFGSLFASGSLVTLVVILGLVALIVPGIILAAWYFYTPPAIMLETKGALDGMGASKAFGRNKKWSTFLIFLSVGLVDLVIGVLQSFISILSPEVGFILGFVLWVPVTAWSSVIPSYTYLTYGPISLHPGGSGGTTSPNVGPSGSSVAYSLVSR